MAAAGGEGAENGLSRYGSAILHAVVSLGGSCSRNEAAIQTGYSLKSSAFGQALRELREAGLLETGRRLAATDSGRRAMPYAAQPPRRGRAAVSFWQDRLGPQCGAFLEALAEAGAEGLGRSELAARTGYSTRSSSFGSSVKRLKDLGLVEGDRGEYVAAESLRY